MTAARGDAEAGAIGARLVALSAEADALTLSQLSAACREIEGGLEALVGSRNVSWLAAADALLRRCIETTDRSGVFSANESADDLATSALPLLLPAFVRGQLLCSSPASSAPQRLAMVQAAVQSHSSFLRRLEQYDLLGDLGSRQYTEEEEEDAGAGALAAAPASNPSMRRQAKIERFKAEKQIAAQLQQMQQRRARLGVDEELGAEETELGGPSGLDEEEERAAWLLRLQSAALKALEQRASLREEQRLLAQAGAAAAEAEAQDPRQRRQQQQQEQQQRDMVMSGLQSIAAQLASSSGGGGGGGRGEGAGERAMAAAHAAALGVHGERERLRAGVFRPSHNLPTMTVEEFGELELAEAMERDKAEKAAQAQRSAAQAAAGDPDYDDAEVQRQRDKDEFKDSNPTGWGNSALRPCGR